MGRVCGLTAEFYDLVATFFINLAYYFIRLKCNFCGMSFMHENVSLMRELYAI